MIYVQTAQGKVDIFSTVKNVENKPNDSIDKQKSNNNYIICMTARSGSTMLCSLLTKTKLLGFPDEYINPRGPMQMYLNKFPAANIFDYFEQIRSHQIYPNSVFGMKTNFPDFKPLLENSLVGKLLNPVKFIYLDRKDIVLQAISSYMARKTGLWHLRNNQTNESNTDIDFDEAQIIKLIDKFIMERLQWERFFNLYSIEPLRITYEDVLANVNETVQQIGEFLEININETIDLSMSETTKIGDEKNQEFAQRIRGKYQL